MNPAAAGDSPLLRHLHRMGLHPDDERVAQLVQVFAELPGICPRHIGQHPGRMIIAAGPPGRSGSVAAGDHGGARRHPVGQGRLRRAWHRQD